ncbi:MAG: sulfur carrier protein ThiS [Desulfuromonadales bacterium]
MLTRIKPLLRLFLFSEVDQMNLKVNGETMETGEDATVSALLRQLGIEPARVAVELNMNIVPKGEYDSALLSEGDTLEIVHFVGGG